MKIVFVILFAIAFNQARAQKFDNRNWYAAFQERKQIIEYDTIVLHPFESYVDDYHSYYTFFMNKGSGIYENVDGGNQGPLVTRECVILEKWIFEKNNCLKIKVLDKCYLSNNKDTQYKYNLIFDKNNKLTEIILLKIKN